MDSNPFQQVVGYWEEVIEDMEVTAAEYREAGWDVIELHPGDVAILDDEQYGIDVLVPDDEFDQLETTIADATPNDTEIYRAEQDGFVFILAVIFDGDSEIAICCPLYYGSENVIELRERVEQTNQLDTIIRTLSDERAITISHDDPGSFFPEVPDSDPSAE